MTSIGLSDLFVIAMAMIMPCLGMLILVGFVAIVLHLRNKRGK